nr:aldo/keto reductase [Candidatus Desulfatibia profunda]
MTLTSILKNTFGRTGPPVTIVGLGGEGVLRTHGREEEATTVIEEAFAAGIT